MRDVNRENIINISSSYNAISSLKTNGPRKNLKKSKVVRFLSWKSHYLNSYVNDILITINISHWFLSWIPQYTRYLQGPKALAILYLVSSSFQKHKSNLFSSFKTSQYFSRTFAYVFQPLQTSSIPCFLNLNHQKDQSYLVLAFCLIGYLISFDFEVLKCLIRALYFSCQFTASKSSVVAFL